MTPNTEEYYLRKCLQQIETSLGWGDSSTWTNYDFEKLSTIVHERTTVRLSVTTLKRIWGKVKYENAPTLTTLNVLAQFAGYADWRSFKQNGNAVAEEIKTTEPVPVIEHQKRGRGKIIYWAVGTMMLAFVIYFFISAGSKPRLNPDLFKFKANKMMTEGVPNSVVFTYDATHAPTDSVYIVQTWDISRKTLVPKDKHEHSAIYYYPGFFNTKLIVNNQVVKRHDLWITSNGWLCLIEDQPMPIYFKKEEYLKADRVEVDQAMLDKHPRPVGAKPTRVRFFNQQDLGELMNDTFTFETEIKNDFDDGTNACHYTEVLIQCKNDIIIIPLAAKNCIGNISLYFCGNHVDAKSADLSGFGCDLTQWTRLRVETINKKVTLFVNDAKAYTLSFPNDPTGIVGVQYRFNGTGATRNTRFESKGKVYELGMK